MIDRRGFLSLLGIAGASQLLSKLPDSLVYEPKLIKAVEAPLGLTRVDIASLTQAIQDEYDRIMDAAGYKTLLRDCDVSRVGETVRFRAPRTFSVTEEERFAMMDTQCNVGMPGFYPEKEYTHIHERYINPAAHSLAAAVRDAKLNVFGTLALPNGGAQAAMRLGGKHGTIRGVMAYRMSHDDWVTRFDIIGGHV